MSRRYHYRCPRCGRIWESPNPPDKIKKEQKLRLGGCCPTCPELTKLIPEKEEE